MNQPNEPYLPTGRRISRPVSGYDAEPFPEPEYCTDVGHGIPCMDSDAGFYSGRYHCRRCRKVVPNADVKPREALERVRAARASVDRLVRDIPDIAERIDAAEISRLLEAAAAEILGKPDPNPHLQAPLL